MKQAKKTRSFRLNEATLKKIKSMGLDINEVVEAAVEKTTKTGLCPYCGK